MLTFCPFDRQLEFRNSKYMKSIFPVVMLMHSACLPNHYWSLTHISIPIGIRFSIVFYNGMLLLRLFQTASGRLSLHTYVGDAYRISYIISTLNSDVLANGMWFLFFCSGFHFPISISISWSEMHRATCVKPIHRYGGAWGGRRPKWCLIKQIMP